MDKETKENRLKELKKLYIKHYINKEKDKKDDRKSNIK